MRNYYAIEEVSNSGLAKGCFHYSSHSLPGGLEFSLQRHSHYQSLGKAKERHAQVRSLGARVLGSHFLEAASRASQIYARSKNKYIFKKQKQIPNSS